MALLMAEHLIPMANPSEGKVGMMVPCKWKRRLRHQDGKLPAWDFRVNLTKARSQVQVSWDPGEDRKLLHAYLHT